MKYIKKAVYVEACQFAGDEVDSGIPLSWIEDGDFDFGPRGEYIIIPSLRGNMRAEKGDYIIKDERGEYYSVKPSSFAHKYELMDN